MNTKTALLITANYPPHGGPHRGWYGRAHAIVRELARQQRDVRVAALRRAQRWDGEDTAENVSTTWIPYWPTVDDFVPLSARHGFKVVRIFVLRAIRELVGRGLGDPLLPALPLFRRRLQPVLDEKAPQVAIVSTPPHGLLGLVPWIRGTLGSAAVCIVDLRDPCTFGDRFMSKASFLGRRILSKFERRAFEMADEVWVVSQGMHDRYAAKYGAHAAKLRIVENGFVQYAELPKPDERLQAFAREQHAQGRTVLGFFGSGFFGRKSPRGKRLNVLNRLSAELPNFPDSTAIVLQGQITGTYGLDKPPVLKLDSAPNAQARANMETVDVGLVVYDNEADADLVLGGKLYDYLAAGLVLWIFAPANAASFQAFARRHAERVVFSDINEIGDMAKGFAAVRALVSKRPADASNAALRDPRIASYERGRILGRAITDALNSHATSREGA